jgi:mRNA-degrading endonuclease toxin of MazEF toxin-antitoxin module
MVAIITTNTVRSSTEPTQLLIDVSTPDGQRTGLLRNSTVKCEHVDTVDQSDIIRKIGSLPPTMRLKLEDCLKAAFDIS